MESKILDPAKNTTKAKFQHYQINKQIHTESTLLRVFRILCGELMTAVTALCFWHLESEGTSWSCWLRMQKSIAELLKDTR